MLIWEGEGRWINFVVLFARSGSVYSGGEHLAMET